MTSDDFKILSHFGQALYSNPEQARTRSIETAAALSTRISLEDPKSFIRAARLLLDRAEREGVSAISSGVHQPFYRLTSFERFTITALHSGRVSYKVLAEILGISSEEIEKLAWHSRMKLASQPEIRAQIPHPAGTRKDGHACPEFFVDHPWTQKLLDDEMKQLELTYIQNHLTACPTCARALATSRKFYYAIESHIPQFAEEEFEETFLRLRRSQIEAGIIPRDMTVSEGLKIFLSRTEIRLMFGLLGALICAWIVFR